jgi:pyruvate dehydrogenase E1 component beta subunit
MVDAIRTALARAMTDDSRVILIGEDIGADGGVFRATEGLLTTFGRDRVIDMPISESSFVGFGVGLSVQGMRPVIEYQFSGFLFPAIDQLVNHASRMRNRTRGRLSCPLVVRAPFGAGVHAPEHHSESAEAMYAHIPGLRVVIPSGPAKAYGLLLAAIRDPDPVLFLEPKRIYRSRREQVSDDGAALALDTCFRLRSGDDISIVTWGACTTEALSAAERLAAQGIQADVIDVATLRPLDMPTILASVERTGRCVIVHEAIHSGGFGAEIAAQLADGGLTSLLAPVRRVTGYDTVVPLARLEYEFLPSEDRIIAAALEVMNYA